MKPVTVAICDDDASEREYFVGLCKRVKEQEGIKIKVNQYETGEALLFHFDDPKVTSYVDIVLLDINMPGKSGTEVAHKLRECGFQGTIIFITRSKEINHFREAFDVQAFNYINKDADAEKRFIKSFTKAAEAAQARRGKTLLLTSIAETRQIDIQSISYFEVRDHIVTVYYNKNDTFEFVSTLKKVESLILEENFIRVHRSFLVAIPHIVKFNSSENNIIVTNGDSIPVTRKYKPMLREVMSSENWGVK